MAVGGNAGAVSPVNGHATIIGSVGGVGSIQIGGTTFQAEMGFVDYFVALTDGATFSSARSVKIDSASLQFARTPIATADGGSLVVFTTTGDAKIDDSPLPRKFADASLHQILLKLSSAGKIEWSTILEAQGAGSFDLDVLEPTTTGFIVGGALNSTSGFNERHLVDGSGPADDSVQAPGASLFLFEYDLAGNRSKTTIWPGQGRMGGVVDIGTRRFLFGDYYLDFPSFGLVQNVPPPANPRQLFLVELGADMKAVKQRAFGFPERDNHARALLLSTDGTRLVFFGDTSGGPAVQSTFKEGATERGFPVDNQASMTASLDDTMMFDWFKMNEFSGEVSTASYLVGKSQVVVGFEMTNYTTAGMVRDDDAMKFTAPATDTLFLQRGEVGGAMVKDLAVGAADVRVRLSESPCGVLAVGALSGDTLMFQGETFSATAGRAFLVFRSKGLAF